MEYKNYISVSTTANPGEQYPIWENGTILIGKAEFLRKDDDYFVFNVQLSEKRNCEHYEFKFSVDATTNELIALRGVKK